MQDALGRIKQLWLDTSRPNQIMVSAAAVAALVVAIGFVYWASAPEYATLVSNASPENANKIISQLKEKKIAYRAANGSIDVPAAQKDELLMELAGTGVLEPGSAGWGMLEKAPFGQTQAMEQETIRRAHEVMMEQTISKLAPVASATVHFTDGDKNELFDPTKKEGTANVTVRVKPGHDLNKENVRSIVALLQSGYANLPATNIYVVDGEGNLRWNGAEQAEGLSSSDERQVQEARKAEELTRKIQSHIDRIAGPGKSTVLVRATLNLDKRKINEHTVLPGQATSKTTSEETLSGGAIGNRAGASGQPGVASNANGAPPTYAGAGNVDASGGKYNSSTSTVTTTPGTRETNTIEAPGEIRTAAVIVTLDKTIKPETVATLKQQIPLLMGDDPANPNPNIRVSVETADFDRSAVAADDKAAKEAASAERINKILQYAVPLGLMLIMLFVLAKALKRPASAGALALGGVGGLQPALAGAGAARGVGGVNMLVGDDNTMGGGGEGAQTLDGEGKIVPVGEDMRDHTFDVINQQFDSNLESILHLARSKPETAAALVKSWMMTEDKK
jgi:flagellar M-ring protein FliF